MHAACTAPRIVKKLLDAAADVNREDQDGATALMGAAKENDLEAVRLLVEARADINVCNKDAETPLFYAGCSGNFAMVRYFIERGVVRYCHKENVVLRDTLIDAVQNYDFATVQAMLTAAIDPNAAAGTRFKMDVNGPGDNYWTPLVHAACTAPRMTKTLSDAAADVNQANENGATALLGAAEYRNPEAVTLLVEARADINVAADDAETPLLYAVRDGDFTMVRYFIERGARVNQCTVDVGTVLHIAAEQNQLDLIQLLLTGMAGMAFGGAALGLVACLVALGAVPCDAGPFCVAGMALRGIGVALGCVGRWVVRGARDAAVLGAASVASVAVDAACECVTFTLLLCGTRGGLGKVERLIARGVTRQCFVRQALHLVAGVALGDRHFAFVWQAWRLGAW
eukprot:s85_g38.t1